MTDSKTDVKEDKAAEKEEEKKFEIVQNPCRALNQQLKYISFNSDQCRYSPLKPLSTGGIILLRDGKPEEPEVQIFNYLGGFKTKGLVRIWEIIIGPCWNQA